MFVCHACSVFCFLFHELFCLRNFVSRSYYCNTVQRTRTVSKILLQVENGLTLLSFLHSLVTVSS